MVFTTEPYAAQFMGLLVAVGIVLGYTRLSGIMLVVCLTVLAWPLLKRAAPHVARWYDKGLKKLWHEE